MGSAGVVNLPHSTTDHTARVSGGSHAQTLRVRPLAGFWHGRGWWSMIMGLLSRDYVPGILLFNGIESITSA